MLGLIGLLLSGKVQTPAFAGGSVHRILPLPLKLRQALVVEAAVGERPPEVPPPAGRHLAADFNVLSVGFAQRTQISIYCAGVTDHKTRHESENRVINLTGFRDFHGGHFALRLKRDGPGTGIGKVLRSDAPRYGLGRFAIQQFIGNGFPVARGFTPELAALGIGNGFVAEHIGPPTLRTRDEGEQVFGRGTKRSAARSNVLLRQQ